MYTLIQYSFFFPSLKGFYFGYIHVQNQTIGSIQFANNTGNKCVCRFPNSSYTIQNVTYYGDREIPIIESFFDPGCRIVNNSGVQRSGYSCSVNITGINNNNGKLSTLIKIVVCFFYSTKRRTFKKIIIWFDRLQHLHMCYNFFVISDVSCSNIAIAPTNGPTITSTIDKSSEQTTSPQQTQKISTKTRSTSSLRFTSSTSQNPTSDVSIKSTSKSVSVFTTQSSEPSKRSTNPESNYVTTKSVTQSTEYATHKRQTSTSNHAPTSTTIRETVVSSNQPPGSTSGPEKPSLSSTIKSSVEYGVSSTAQSTGEHIDTTTKQKSEKKSDLKREYADSNCIILSSTSFFHRFACLLIKPPPPSIR